MKRNLQILLLVLSGLGVLHASLFTDLYLRYVKEGMRPLLIASGVLLILLGVAEAWSRQGTSGGTGDGGEGGAGTGTEAGTGTRAGTGTDEHAHAGESHGAHDHSGMPRVAWLLFLPALSLLFYAPPALGAYTASREPPKAVTPQDDFEPLPAISPLPITLRDFTSRVQQDRGQAIKGRTVLMTGFVTPGKGGGWYLTRIMLSCCAADAQSVKVLVDDVPAPPADTWVTLTGTWHAGGTLGTSSAPVALDARTVRKVARPTNGYTDALPLGPS
ncbi:TIGR03943 family putative permease subunit [Streptomyces sp. NPDC087903]|uniref:TIGR03943 family putative permease subunit n=1 Tax=Streptomyces sp. NPDC087903 TaxID=3365819 RepID=UPI0038157861